MAIYGRWGDEVTILRMGTLEDVKTLDHRTPDKVDRQYLDAGSYVVVVDVDGVDRLYHLGYLRADGGSVEIMAAVEACKSKA